MTFVPDTQASGRLYSKHQRYARLPRFRYSAQRAAFINREATALYGGDSPAHYTDISDFLYANTAFKISQVESVGSLTADATPNRGS